MRTLDAKLLLVLAGLIAALSVGTASAGGPIPVLGGADPTVPYQEGYGKPHPATISNGGDPTGLVAHVHWTGWGKPIAYGTGVSTWVWPGTAVADNGPSAARLAAYHLGTCHGKRTYNAFEWWFPEYGETFNSKGPWVNTCTGKWVPRRPGFPKTVNCPDAVTADGVAAHQVSVTVLTCAQGDAMIATIPVGTYDTSLHHWLLGAFRCGTSGFAGGAGFTLVECTAGQRDVLFSVYQ